jgi:TolB-like protein/DNA-binding winged helix-turn-helix (wHTH) protein/Tfp pilus assembly protein PilF
MAAAGSAATSVRFGPFEIDLRTGDLLRSGRKIKLQPQPAKVLCLLATRAGELVTREQLQQETWGPDTFVDFNHGLNFSIRQIRTCLGDDPDHPVYIETIPRRGYRFIAPVQRVDSAATPPAAASEVEAPAWLGSQTVSTGKVQHELLRAGKRKRYLWAIAISLALLLITSMVVYRLVAQRPITSIAVLPFNNSPAEEEYVDEGLTDGLIHDLSHLQELKVISRASAVRFKGRTVDPQTLGRDLGVGSVLTGRFGKRGDSLLLAVELVDTSDGRVLWSGQYSWASDRVSAIQSDIAGEVAQNLRVKASAEEQRRLAERHTGDPEAYLLYMKGRAALYRWTEPELNGAIVYFQKATEKDPKFALAYAGLADTYYALSGMYVPPSEAMPKARAAALRALELDETLSDAHVSLGLVKSRYDWDWSGSEHEFKRAIELNRSNAMAHLWYGWSIAATGQFGPARAELQRAHELDPLSTFIEVGLAQTFYYARQYDEAIARLRKIVELDPGFLPARYTLGIVYAQKRMYKEALTEIQKAVAMGDDAGVQLWVVGYAHAACGNRLEAERVLARIPEDESYSRATIYAALGDKDVAFEQLDQAYRGRDELLFFIKIDPSLEPLNSDPRFKVLLRRLALEK